MTKWSPDLEQYPGPRYQALANAIEDGIRQGRLRAGQKLPTHRALARDLGVTVGTITRGYAEAERRQLVVARVGSGTYICDEKPDGPVFSIHNETTSGVVDLSLSLAVPGQQQTLLAQALNELQGASSEHGWLLEYQPVCGSLRHRQVAADWLRRYGVSAVPERLSLCNGGQHAMSIALQAVTRPGDLVLSDGLTFAGFSALAARLHLRHQGLPMDEQGLIPEELERLCEHQQPRVLFLMPALQNPTATVMPLERRHRLIEIANRYNLFVVEDDVGYTDHATRLPPLVSMAPERVLYINSVSKSIAAGLRVGFLLVPPRQAERVEQILRSDCWTTSPLMAELVCRWIESGQAEAHCRWNGEELRARHELSREYFQGFEVSSQPSSAHCWLQLPEHWRAEAFVRQAELNGVRVKSAETFAVGRVDVPQAVRVCLSSARSQDQLSQGLARLRHTLLQLPRMSSSIL